MGERILKQKVRKIYDIKAEPVGDTYRGIIDFAANYCDKFILVLRKMPVDETTHEALNRLEKHLINIEKKTEWPGTRLHGGNTAEVYSFSLNDETAEVIKNTTDRLYSWVHPTLPEDLCLIRPDGDPWLVTIAHEDDAYFFLTAEESIILDRTFPELGLEEHKNGDLQEA